MNERETRILVCIFVARGRPKNKVEPRLTITSDDTPATRLFAQPSFSITLCYPTCSNKTKNRGAQASLRQEHFARVLDVLLHSHCMFPRRQEQSHQRFVRVITPGQQWDSRTEERHSLSPIEQPVVVGQSDNHYRPYHNLSINDDRSIFGCMHPYHFRPGR